LAFRFGEVGDIENSLNVWSLRDASEGWEIKM
jgi:hypothetical protein